MEADKGRLVGGCEREKVVEKDEEYGGCQEGQGDEIVWGMGIQEENEVPLEVLSGSPPCIWAQPDSWHWTTGPQFSKVKAAVGKDGRETENMGCR